MQNRVMLSGECNENGEKTKIGLISKKATLHVQPTFFVHFFALVLHDYNVKLPEASWLHVLWRKCRPCSCSLFFYCRSFSPRWPLAFLIFSPPLQNFMLFLQQKMSPLFFLSRSSSFSRWASLACRLTFFCSLSFSFSIFQICGHDNKSRLNTLDNRIQRQFPLSVFVFIDSFVVSAFVSRQNSLELYLGCHTCWLRYFTLVCQWCGRTVSRVGGRCTVTWLQNFLGWVDYFIFLPMVLHWRALHTRALL